MKKLFPVLLLFIFSACNSSPDKTESALTDSATVDAKAAAPGYIHHFADTALANKITAALLKLPFVQKSDAYIDSFSNHTHGISFMLDSTGNGKDEISVQAGYNGDQRFETYYHFYVNPKDLDIKVYDPVADKKLSLEEYLKLQK